MATVDIVGVHGGRTNSRQYTQTSATPFLVAANGTGEKFSASADYLGNELIIGVGFTNDYYKNYATSTEPFMYFDFSSLPAGTINSASLSITYRDNNGFGSNSTPRYIYFYLYDWGAGVDPSDYVAGSLASTYTLLSSIYISTGYPPLGTQYSGSFLLSEISKRTTTKLAVISGTTIKIGTGGVVSGDDLHYDQYYNRTATNVSYRPKITVNYTPSAPTGPTYNLIVRPM
jgi:hypothetical protein